jgi:hypothetical protein
MNWHPTLDGFFAAIYFLATRGGLHQTMYQIYRPQSYPKQILPSVMSLVWSTGFLLLSVSFYYTSTVTSDNEWINEFAPNIDRSYDALLGMEFVTLALIVGWGPTIRLLDDINTYSKQGKAAAAIISGHHGAADEAPNAGTGRRRKVGGGRTIPNASASKEVGYNAAQEDIFVEKVFKYHVHNYWVKCGCFLYVLVLMGIATTVIAFLETKYNYADEDHSFFVLFWTWVVGYSVIVFGFFCMCYVSLFEIPADAIKNDIRTNPETIIKMRSEERELAMTS